jgi:hypothetical protein
MHVDVSCAPTKQLRSALPLAAEVSPWGIQPGNVRIDKSFQKHIWLVPALPCSPCLLLIGAINDLHGSHATSLAQPISDAGRYLYLNLWVPVLFNKCPACSIVSLSHPTFIVNGRSSASVPSSSSSSSISVARQICPSPEQS